jgi:hypothetical protein
VVGAGPSLNKHLPLLKKYRDNIIIVACDAALPVLAKADCYPHFVVMVDPTEKQKDNFIGIDTTKFYSIVPPIVHPAVFRMIDPKHLAMYNVKDPHSIILEQAPYHTGKIGALPAGVLSSGSAFAFAAAMFCSPIMFIGHDLCWEDPNKGRVYAEGVNPKKIDFQKGSKFRHGCLLFPDINGQLVVTHSTFLNFWAWLKDSVEVLKIQVINCSECGILKSKDIKAIPFQTALDKYASKKLTGVDERIKKAYNSRYADGVIEKILTPGFKKRGYNALP